MLILPMLAVAACATQTLAQSSNTVDLVVSILKIHERPVPPTIRYEYVERNYPQVESRILKPKRYQNGTAWIDMKSGVAEWAQTGAVVRLTVRLRIIVPRDDALREAVARLNKAEAQLAEAEVELAKAKVRPAKAQRKIQRKDGLSVPIIGVSEDIVREMAKDNVRLAQALLSLTKTLQLDAEAIVAFRILTQKKQNPRVDRIQD